MNKNTFYNKIMIQEKLIKLILKGFSGKYLLKIEIFLAVMRTNFRDQVQKIVCLKRTLEKIR